MSLICFCTLFHFITHIYNCGLLQKPDSIIITIRSSVAFIAFHDDSAHTVNRIIFAFDWLVSGRTGDDCFSVIAHHEISIIFIRNTSLKTDNNKVDIIGSGKF